MPTIESLKINFVKGEGLMTQFGRKASISKIKIFARARNLSKGTPHSMRLS
jgi:hypothetical protein